MKKRIAGLVLTGVAVTGLGLTAAGAAFADPTPTPGTSTATASPDATTGTQNGRDGHKGDGMGRGQQDGAMAKELAEKLGVDEAKVTEALNERRAAHQAEHKAAFSTKLDQAVTDGKLTRAEADAVLKAAEAGVIPMGGRGR